MRKLASLALVIASLTTGCGKSDTKGNAKTTSGETGKAGTKDSGALFTGTAPALPAEVAALSFGSPRAEALKAVGADSTYVPSKIDKKVSYNLVVTDEKLRKVSVTADRDLEPLLTKQWGPPIKTEKEAFWFNAATGVRAYLPGYGGGKTVTFDAYEPVENVIGAKGTDFTFANGKPLFGATLEEARAALGERLCDYAERAPELQNAFDEAEKNTMGRLEWVRRELRYCPALPRTVETSAPFGDEVRFGLDGRLASVFMSFKTGGSEELQKQLLALFDQRYGTPTELTTDDGVERYYFEPNARIRTKVSVSDQSVSLEQSSYLPVTELIGGDKPGLSIEGPHMPVGTFAQIKADDPTHYRQLGILASLYYPPTEYNQQHTEAELQIYIGDKETHGYRVVLQHTKNEAAGDQVFELLKAKFGEPTKDKRSTDADMTYDFSKNGRKVAARRVSEQWEITVTK